jgi:hypothetical protein
MMELSLASQTVTGGARLDPGRNLPTVVAAFDGLVQQFPACVSKSGASCWLLPCPCCAGDGFDVKVEVV